MLPSQILGSKIIHLMSVVVMLSNACRKLSTYSVKTTRLNIILYILLYIVQASAQDCDKWWDTELFSESSDLHDDTILKISFHYQHRLSFVHRLANDVYSPCVFYFLPFDFCFQIP